MKNDYEAQLAIREKVELSERRAQIKADLGYNLQLAQMNFRPANRPYAIAFCHIAYQMDTAPNAQLHSVEGYEKPVTVSHVVGKAFAAINQHVSVKR
jgi:hypothetical protein